MTASRPSSIVVRWTDLLAGMLWLLGVVLTVVGVVAELPTGAYDVVLIATGLAASAAAISAVTTGALLAVRVPRHPVGWLLLAGGFLLSLSNGAGALATAALSESAGPGWIAWLSGLWWGPMLIVLGIFLPLFFPTGHLPSPRWRPVVAVAAGALAGLVLQKAFGPFDPGTTTPGVVNPLAIGGTGGDLLAMLGGATTVAGIVCFPLAAVSLVARFRRAAGTERAQLKWFAGAAAILGPALAVAVATSGATSGVALAIGNAAWLVAVGGLGLLPVAIAVAVLRYRLYEIDRLISRTLVYGALAAFLAAAYSGSVLLLSALLDHVTSGDSVAVAGSTLVAAALFSPLRARLKAAVDRRFNRSRYDAANELANLNQRLGTVAVLAGVRAEVVGTIELTMQPVSVAMWLRADLPEPDRGG